jgi:hypothetical protein
VEVRLARRVDGLARARRRPLEDVAGRRDLDERLADVVADLERRDAHDAGVLVDEIAALAVDVPARRPGVGMLQVVAAVGLLDELVGDLREQRVMRVRRAPVGGASNSAVTSPITA